MGHVEVPRELPQLAAIFIVLRKIRAPLLVVIVAMCVGTLGLSVMPAPSGEPRLTVFQAFYFMTFTASTIGLGEIPYTFSAAQRVWVIFCIFLGVITWTYTLYRVSVLAGDSAFISARRGAAFRRAVSRLHEPFMLALGYGYIGRNVVRALDARGRRVVVVDRNSESIERIATDLLNSDVPSYAADAREPSMLGVAGLDNPLCEAVLALTGDERVNLQVVMTCRLLRPNLPVLARAKTTEVAEAMRDFNPTAILNASEDYARFLVLSLHRRCTYRLITWLMSEAGAELPPLPPAFTPKHWVIASDGPVAEKLASHLNATGHQVERVEPLALMTTDLSSVDAVVCGAESDSTNLALAAHVRRTHPETYLAVRVMSHHRLPLLDAFAPDSVFFPPGMVARRVLVYLVHPHYWAFITAVMAAPDAWSREVTQRLTALLTTRSPIIRPLRIDHRETPAVARWLERRPLLLGDLFRSPSDHDNHISAAALMLVRGRTRTMLPDETTELKLNDELLVAGRSAAFGAQTEVIYDDSTLHYAVTGQTIPTSWVGRLVTHRHQWEHDDIHQRSEHMLRPWPSLPNAQQQPKSQPAPHL